MSRFRFAAVALLSLLAQAAHAAPITIDFEEFAGVGAAPLSFTSKSYLFTQTTGFTGVLDGPFGGSGTGTSFFFCPQENCTGTGNPSFSFEAEDGRLFSLFSMDLGFLQGDPFPTTVTGVFADGTTIIRQLDSLGGWFDTVSFDSNWSDLQSVSVLFDNTGNDFFNVPGVDNIVASVVPVPAAVWLFGSALAGLGWLRRRAG